MPSPVVNLIIRSAMDRDALAFCTASGATDKAIISAFVKGVKALGIWNNMVCWPLRSAQNAGGVSTTVYSLGGIATINGTMTNGPTWGATGMTFATNTTTGRDRYISLPWTGQYDLRTNSTALYVSNLGEQGTAVFDQHGLISGGSGAYAGANSRDGSSAGDMAIYGPVSAGAVNYAVSNSNTVPAGTHRMWTAQRENNLVGNSNTQGNKLWKDTTQIGNGSNAAQIGYETMTAATTTLNIGSRSGSSLAPVGEIAFAAIISDWTVSVSSFHALLKSTILSGVLP